MNTTRTIDHHEGQLHTNVNLMDHLRKYLQVGALATALAMPMTDAFAHKVPDGDDETTPTAKTSVVFMGQTITFVSSGDANKDTEMLLEQHPKFLHKKYNVEVVDEPDECRQKLGLAVYQNLDNRDYFVNNQSFMNLLECVGKMVAPDQYPLIAKQLEEFRQAILSRNASDDRVKKRKEIMAFIGK